MDEGVLSSATDSGPLNIWFSGPFFFAVRGHGDDRSACT